MTEQTTPDEPDIKAINAGADAIREAVRNQSPDLVRLLFNGDYEEWAANAIKAASKKPIPLAASQWWRNGDHPDDQVGEIVPDPAGGDYRRVEGAVVRFFRDPHQPGHVVHERCGRTWHDHGWLDTLEGRNGAQVVCPGDWIVTGVQGEMWPVKPDIFAATYEPVGA